MAAELEEQDSQSLEQDQHPGSAQGQEQEDPDIAQMRLDAQSGMYQTFHSPAAARLSTAIYSASKTTPDKAAEAQRLSSQTGIGADIVQRNLDDVRRRAAVNTIDYQLFSQQSPRTTEWASNPDNAAIAHDQLDNLTTTEKIFNWFKAQDAEAHDLPGAFSDVANQWQSGKLAYERSMLGYKAHTGNITGDDWTRISDIDQQLKTLGPNKTFTGTLSNFAGSFAPMISHSLSVGAMSGLAAGGTAALVGAATGPGDLVIAPGAATLGFSAGFSGQMAMEGAQQAAGQSYLDMVAKGVDKDTALTASTGVGLINGALQAGFLRIAGKPVGAAVSNAFSKAVGEEISAQLVRPTVMKAVSSAVFGMAKNSAAGGADMAAQTVVSQFGEELAKYHDTGDLETALNNKEKFHELATNAASAFVNGMVITTAMGAGPEMLNLHTDIGRAQAADRSQKFFTALSENVAGSEVRKRNPNAYESFIAAQASDSGADTTYIDGQKMAELLHQTGLDPVAVEKVMPGFSKQLIEAQATGGDVEIPTAKFAAHLAGTDLGNAMTEHLRLDPDKFSPAMQRDFNANLPQYMAQAKASAAERIANDAGFAQSAKNVEDRVFQQLQATNTLPDDVQRTNAQMMSSMVSTLANREGVTPEEFYAKYEAPIRRAGATVLAQAANPDQVGSLSELTGNMDEAERRYDSLGQPDFVSGDRVKELLQGWSERGNRPALEEKEHADASKIAYNLFYRKAARLPKNSEVDLVTGPVAAGKSSFVGDEQGLTYEVNLSNKEKAFEHLDKLLIMGLRPSIDYVYTTPELSVERRASRAEMDGRTVRIDRSTAQHLELPATMQAIADRYGDRVVIKAYDTSVHPAQEVPVAEIAKLAYTGTEDNLLEQQQRHLDSLRDNDSISVELHRNLSKRTEDASEASEAGGRESSTGTGAVEQNRRTEGRGESSKASEELEQASPSSEARGGFDPITRNILLGDKADFTTFAHEAGHYYLSVLSEMSREERTSERVKADMATLLNWFGVTADQWKQWDEELKATGKINPEQAKFHEQFAYTWEKYLADGKAPTPELQGAFDRFSRWVKSAYSAVVNNSAPDKINAIYKRQHGVDLPDSNNEVKQVMGRMLASDEQIKQGEAERNMEPIFKEKPDSMADNEWAAYQQLHSEASDEAASKLSAASIRQMQWLSRAKSRALKELQNQHDSLRAETREEVAKEVARDPVRRAINWLKNGITEDPKTGEEVKALEGHKLNRTDVESMYPESGLGEKPDFSRLKGMLTDKSGMEEGGLHPDLVAEMHGFDNGDQMIRQIADARPVDEEIDARTDQRMLERHGEMNDPQAMNDQVDKALHNEARQRFVAMELRHLQNATTPVRVMTNAADAVAKKMIAEKPIGEVNPRDYSIAETRAAKAAEEAMKRGDSAGAVKAKQNQLIQHSLAREAADVQEESQKIQRYLGKFVTPKLAMAKAIGADYMDRINELLAGYSLTAREPAGEGSREDISSWVRSEYDRTGIMPAVSDELMASMGRMHWKDMNIGQLRDLSDAVKSLDYIGRRDKMVEVDGEQREVAEVASEVHESMAGMKHGAPVDIRASLKYAQGMDKISTGFLQFKSWIRSGDASLLKMEQFFQWMDAGKDAGLKEADINGPMQKNVFRRMTQADGHERTMRAESVKALRDIAESLKGEHVDLREVLNVPELPRNGSAKWFRGEFLAMALNMGNESNKEKMLKGQMWYEADAVSAINRLLSKGQMDFVQGIWDHIGSYGKEIVELQRRQTGLSPKMIVPSEVSTKWGTYRGGYYPMVFDDFQDRNIELKRDRNADRLFENNYANAATAKGHTIERNGYVGPVWFNLDVIQRHINQVTHDLAWREAITDANKVLTDPRILDEVDQTYGKEYSRQFRKWLQGMANDRVFDTSADTFWDRQIRKARTNMTMVQIGFNPKTLLVHGISALSNSIGEIGPTWFAKGVAQFVGADRIQATKDFVFDRSPEMANRMNSYDRNVSEAINRIEQAKASFTSPSKVQSLIFDAQRFGMHGVAMSDMASAMPTWMGAYLKGMAKESDGGMNLSEEDSVEYANRAVRNAHGGGGVKDMAEAQRSTGPSSLLTMFYSYWNHVYQRERDIGKGWAKVATGNASVRDMPKLLARSWFYFVIPQIAHAMIAGRKDKDDDGTLGSYLIHIAKEVAAGPAMSIPIAREGMSALVNGTAYSISPVEQVGTSLIQTARDAIHKLEGAPVSKNAIGNVVKTVGYAKGMPISQPFTTTRFLWDVMDGDQDPEGLSDWWKGITTGKIP